MSECNHKEIVDSSFYGIASKMAVLIEEALHRDRTILHTSITSDSYRFYGVIIWQEKTANDMDR